MLYRKKPVVIEAHRWWMNGDHPHDRVGMQELDEAELRRLHPELWNEDGTVGPVPEDAPTYTRREGALVRYYRNPLVSGVSACPECEVLMHKHGWIDTLEGGHRVCPGDWIITGVQGEHYPCKPGIFEQTYEPVED